MDHNPYSLQRLDAAGTGLRCFSHNWKMIASLGTVVNCFLQQNLPAAAVRISKNCRIRYGMRQSIWFRNKT